MRCLPDHQLGSSLLVDQIPLREFLEEDTTMEYAVVVEKTDGKLVTRLFLSRDDAENFRIGVVSSPVVKAAWIYKADG
jgi:hypothetical protein